MSDDNPDQFIHQIGNSRRYQIFRDFHSKTTDGWNIVKQSEARGPTRIINRTIGICTDGRMKTFQQLRERTIYMKSTSNKLGRTKRRQRNQEGLLNRPPIAVDENRK